MRKFFYLLALMLTVGFTLQSCNKDKAVEDQGTDVTFAIHQTDFPGFKDYDPGNVPECVDGTLDYAVFTINGVDYTSPVLFANGKLLTQPIKLYTGTYTLTNFLVYHDVLPIGQGAEDILLRAAPAIGSEYWDLMENPLDVDIVIEGFKKKEFLIDVLCFEDLFYDKFGFTWFEMNLVKIERQCFFGDICTGKLWQYEGSAYADQEAGLQMDMPAIMQIEVYKGETLIRTFDNMGDFHWDAETDTYLGYNGEGACMEVYWANDEDLEEEFTFVLYVWLPVGDHFEYVKYHTWTFLDDNCPDTGEDGVVDYTIGECDIDGADYVFAPYVNLPSESFTLVMDHFGSLSTGVPASLGTYMDITLSGIVGGPYDIDNGSYGSFCGQHDVNITQGTNYTVKVASSLYPLPQALLDQVTLDEVYTAERMSSINWIINHLGDYTGYAVDMDDWNNNPQELWVDFQLGLWYLLDVDAGAATAWTADASAHSSYVPLPGEYAIDIFYSVGQKEITPVPMQFMVTLVDP